MSVPSVPTVPGDVCSFHRSPATSVPSGGTATGSGGTPANTAGGGSVNPYLYAQQSRPGAGVQQSSALSRGGGSAAAASSGTAVPAPFFLDPSAAGFAKKSGTALQFPVAGTAGPSAPHLFYPSVSSSMSFVGGGGGLPPPSSTAGAVGVGASVHPQLQRSSAARPPLPPGGTNAPPSSNAPRGFPSPAPFLVAPPGIGFAGGTPRDHLSVASVASGGRGTPGVPGVVPPGAGSGMFTAVPGITMPRLSVAGVLGTRHH